MYLSNVGYIVISMFNVGYVVINTYIVRINIYYLVLQYSNCWILKKGVKNDPKEKYIK